MAIRYFPKRSLSGNNRTDQALKIRIFDNKNFKSAVIDGVLFYSQFFLFLKDLKQDIDHLELWCCSMCRTIQILFVCGHSDVSVERTWTCCWCVFTGFQSVLGLLQDFIQICFDSWYSVALTRWALHGRATQGFISWINCSALVHTCISSWLRTRSLF